MITAWETGLDGSKIPDMTPAEAHGLFVARAARQRQNMANADTLAWLIGSYTAVGVNNPKRYPHEPRNAGNLIRQQKREMSDEEMEAWGRAFAEKYGRNEHGDDG